MVALIICRCLRSYTMVCVVSGMYLGKGNLISKMRGGVEERRTKGEGLLPEHNKVLQTGQRGGVWHGRSQGELQGTDGKGRSMSAIFSLSLSKDDREKSISLMPEECQVKYLKCLGFFFPHKWDNPAFEFEGKRFIGSAGYLKVSYL